MNLTYKDIIVINQDYLNYLHSFDSRVRINHGEKERPNLGILLDDKGSLWAIPLSHSARERSSEIFYNLYDDENQRYYGHLKFNNMIPVAKDTYQSAFEVNKKDYKYMSLLSLQEKIIKQNFSLEIEPRFKNAFKYAEKAKKNPGNKFLKMFNDFDLLKQAKNRWELINDCANYIDELNNEKPPKYEKINVLARNVIDSNEYEKVFEYNKIAYEYLKHMLIISEKNLRSKDDDQREM